MGSQYQTREATPTAQVQRPVRRGDDGEAEGMLELRGGGAATDEAEPLGPLDDSVEPVVQAVSEVAAGMITTRRRGSSPSDVVTTPAIPFTVSCTILRCAGCMGSRALDAPDASTSLATWVANRSSASLRRWR